MKNYIKKALNKIDIFPTDDMIEKLEKYMRSILEWNEKINLTAITNEHEFILKHYVDSLSISSLPQFSIANSIIDVGTGGGFPGIPLAIANPQKGFVLLDSTRKRVELVGSIAKECGIENVSIIHSRAEDAADSQKYRESFDLCVSRAVANLRTLCELTLPLVKVGGSFIAFKGSSPKQEIKESQNAIKTLGAKLKEIKFVKTDEYTHSLIVIDKIVETPKRYPRKAGAPNKKPL